MNNQRHEKVFNILLQAKAIEVKTDDSFFEWTSGIQSPIYCDNRLLLSYPELRDEVVSLFVELIEKENMNFDCIAGVATAGIPWASFLAQKLGKPMIFVRSKAKEHGKKSQIEGVLKPSQKVLVVEDLISTAKSSAVVVSALKEAGAIVENLVSVFSYKLDIAQKNLHELGVNYQSLTDLPYIYEKSSLPIHTKEKLLHFWGELNS